MQAESDPLRLRNMYTEAVKELAVLKRSAIVNQIYGGRKLAVEIPEQSQPEEFKQRGDN